MSTAAVDESVVIESMVGLAVEEAADRLIATGWFRDTPEIRRMLAEARAQLGRAVAVDCAWGWCSNDVDPFDGVILGGAGPVMCPCENLPGWKSQYVAGRPKPPVPVKAAGRHGSRVQRSARRHTLPDWGADFVWLPVLTRAAIAAASVETTNDDENARTADE